MPVGCRQDPSEGIDFDPDTVKRMADQGQWVDPTIGHSILGYEATARGEAPPRAIHWSVQASDVSDADHYETLNLMHDAGVRFTNGLDMGMPHGTHDRSAANSWSVVRKPRLGQLERAADGNLRHRRSVRSIRRDWKDRAGQGSRPCRVRR